jgi:hypothetical protein
VFVPRRLILSGKARRFYALDNLHTCSQILD